MCAATTYEDIPNEVRVMIWKYRTELRKQAATIIFRNLARNAIANRLSQFLQFLDASNPHRSPALLMVYADQYSYGLLVYWNKQKVQYIHPRVNAFLSDIRNLEIDYDNVHHSEDGDVDLTEFVRDAHQEFKLRFFNIRRLRRAWRELKPPPLRKTPDATLKLAC